MANIMTNITARRQLSTRSLLPPVLILCSAGRRLQLTTRDLSRIWIVTDYTRPQCI